MTALEDLKAGMSAEQLIPGDLAGLTALSSRIGNVADQLNDMAQGISYIDLHGDTWSGEAADVYASARDLDISSFKGAGVVFDDVQSTIDDYISNLKDARHLASVAVADFKNGQKKQKDDEANCTIPPPPANPLEHYDPYGFDAAAAKVDQARRMVETSASLAVPIIKQATAMAPVEKVPLTPSGDAGGPSMKDIASAPWRMLHGAGRMGKGLLEQLETLPNAFEPPGAPPIVPPNDGQEDYEAGTKEWAGGTLTALTVAAMLYGAKAGVGRGLGKAPVETPPEEPVKVPATRGGIAPVLKGQAGVNAVTKDLEDTGWTVTHEVTLKTDVNGTEVRTRVDIIARKDDGSLMAIEVKNGPHAGLTPNQQQAYPVVRSSGFTPVGKNAELAGFEVGQAHGPIPVWTVHLP